MRKLFAIGAVLVLSLVMLPAATVGAGPPDDVFIEVPDFEGPFTASGSAVDNGVVCATGEVVDVAGKAAGFQSGQGFNLQILKEFTCDDDSGTFLVKLQVRITDMARFNWMVFDGTGTYADLHGTGRGVAAPCEAGCAFADLYFGKMHID